MQTYHEDSDVTPDKPKGGVFDILSNLNGLTPAGLEHLIQTQKKYIKSDDGLSKKDHMETGADMGLPLDINDDKNIMS